GSGNLYGDDESDRSSERIEVESPVAATIDGDISITRREVEQLVNAIAQDENLSPVIQEQMRRTALNQLIGRQIILKYLEEKQSAATETDLKAYLSQLQTRLDRQGIDWTVFLGRIGLSQAEFEMSVRWKLSWDNYLRARLTRENLDKFYEPRRQHFDGTEISIRQILIKLAPNSSQSDIEKATGLLRQVKQNIERQQLTFNDAVKEYSQAESARFGGGQGRIQRHDSLPESLSKAAFDLKESEISAPVVTNIGVHLVICDQIFPGQKTREETAQEVRRAAIRYLFDWVVTQRKGEHTIKVMMFPPSDETGS
ncbi:MAG: peptidylprolyl isomerase, partial [Planctomycetota bacterium]|nr:peptidylprolyl isomerase [Planctomycetota bacterium]